MIIHCSQWSHSAMYHVLTQTVIPRPVALVLSDNGDGSYNLAPFSFFNAVCASPPIVSISVGTKSDGSIKDTWRNIQERSHFVVHIPSVGDVDSVVASSKEIPFGDSELPLTTQTVVDQPDWGLPRLASPTVAFYCKRFAIHLIGDGPQGLLLGEITSVYLDDSVASVKSDRIVVDPQKVDPLARLGGNFYSSLGTCFQRQRP